jgi:hypothetical protein
MVSHFKVKIYLPVLQKYVNIKQFTNHTYKTLLKHLANKDVETCNEFINDIVSNHTDYDTNNLCVIDRFVILLNLRCISVNHMITHAIEKEKNKYNLNYSVYDIIQKVTDNGCIITDKIIMHKNYKIHMCVPKNVLISVEDIHNFIEKIIVGDKVFILDNFTNIGRDEIANTLPGSILYELYEEIQSITSKINNIELASFKVDVDSKETQKLKMYLDKDNMMIVLSIFFNELLTNLFIKQFILSKEYNISCEYFDSLPPIESEIMYNFHKEIEEKSNEQNSSKPKGPNIPGVPAPGIG